MAPDVLRRAVLQIPSLCRALSCRLCLWESLFRDVQSSDPHDRDRVVLARKQQLLLPGIVWMIGNLLGGLILLWGLLRKGAFTTEMLLPSWPPWAPAEEKVMGGLLGLLALQYALFCLLDIFRWSFGWEGKEITPTFEEPAQRRATPIETESNSDDSEELYTFKEIEDELTDRGE